MFAHTGEAEQKYCLPLITQVRDASISAELYPDVTKKISKQFDYANKKGIEYVVVVGSEEMKDGMLNVKHMTDGAQEKMTIGHLIGKLK